MSLLGTTYEVVQSSLLPTFTAANSESALSYLQQNSYSYVLVRTTDFEEQLNSDDKIIHLPFIGVGFAIAFNLCGANVDLPCHGYDSAEDFYDSTGPWIATVPGWLIRTRQCSHGAMACPKLSKICTRCVCITLGIPLFLRNIFLVVSGCRVPADLLSVLGASPIVLLKNMTSTLEQVCSSAFRLPQEQDIRRL